jgi:hypothetical protein
MILDLAEIKKTDTVTMQPLQISKTDLRRVVGTLDMEDSEIASY